MANCPALDECPFTCFRYCENDQPLTAIEEDCE